MQKLPGHSDPLGRRLGSGSVSGGDLQVQLVRGGVQPVWGGVPHWPSAWPSRSRHSSDYPRPDPRPLLCGTGFLVRLALPLPRRDEAGPPPNSGLLGADPSSATRRHRRSRGPSVLPVPPPLGSSWGPRVPSAWQLRYGETWVAFAWQPVLPDDVPGLS